MLSCSAAARELLGCCEGSTMPRQEDREDLCRLHGNDAKCSFSKALSSTFLRMEDNGQEIFLAKCPGFSSTQMWGEGSC